MVRYGTVRYDTVWYGTVGCVLVYIPLNLQRNDLRSKKGSQDLLKQLNYDPLNLIRTRKKDLK